MKWLSELKKGDRVFVGRTNLVHLVAKVICITPTKRVVVRIGLNEKHTFNPDGTSRNTDGFYNRMFLVKATPRKIDAYHTYRKAIALTRLSFHGMSESSIKEIHEICKKENVWNY